MIALEASGDNGVTIRVEGRGRPSLRVEGTRGKGADLYRISSGASVPLWVAVEDWWQESIFIRADSRHINAVVGPIGADEARSTADWVRFFANALRDTRHGPLHNGTFRLQRLSCRKEPTRRGMNGNPNAPIWPHVGGRQTSLESIWEEEWTSSHGWSGQSVLPLRMFARADDGRRKWWRKLARAGALPPVLTWYLAPLEKHVVLDGHLRLLAALDEGVDIPVVALWYEQAAPPIQTAERRAIEGHATSLLDSNPNAVDAANSLLIAAYEPRWTAALQGWPLEGGTAAWFEGALRELNRAPDGREDIITWLRGVTA